jgi:hypothetical protein
VKDRKKLEEQQHEAHEREERREIHERAENASRGGSPNPPRTTTDGITAPKFGSAGSGGLELEPGPERD